MTTHTHIVTLGFNVKLYCVETFFVLFVPRLIFFFELYHIQIHCLLDEQFVLGWPMGDCQSKIFTPFQSHKNLNVGGFALGLNFHSHDGTKEILLSHTPNCICMYLGRLTFFVI